MFLRDISKIKRKWKEKISEVIGGIFQINIII